MRALLILLLTIISLFSALENGKIAGNLLRHLQTSALKDEDYLNVWIYFKDKPLVELAKLDEQIKDKTAETIISTLHENTIFRRANRKGIVNPTATQIVDDYDFPIDPGYIEAVFQSAGLFHSFIHSFELGESAIHRCSSKWLNAISLRTQVKALSVLSSLECVERVDGVAQHRQVLPRLSKRSDGNVTTSGDRNITYNFGPSFVQLEQIQSTVLLEEGDAGAGVTVLMIDTGFNIYHYSFKGLNIVGMHDFINNINNTVINQPNDDVQQEMHGTATLSLIGTSTTK